MGKIFRPSYLMLIVGLCFWPFAQVTAQRQDIQAAAAQFNKLPVNARYEIQMLLMAGGYSDFVANEEFSKRLFDVISAFQRGNGLVATGALDSQQFDRLRAVAEPNLARWNLQRVHHPLVGTPLWIPVGFNLAAKRTPEGLEYFSRNGTNIAFGYYQGTDIDKGYQGVRGVLLQSGARITYEISRPDFFVVAAAPGAAEHYARFHKLRGGIVGFLLSWNPAQTPDGRWLGVMMSDLFRSAVSLNLDRVPPSPRTVSSLTPPVPAPLPTGEYGKPPPAAGFSGTGFYISGGGHILTNAHVVDSCKTIEAIGQGAERRVSRLVARDVINDLALLVTDYAPSKFARLRSGARIGETVAVFGFPLMGILATTGNFTVGNVTAAAGLLDDTRMLQISAPIQPGNSGGPLLDQYGNVIGIVVAKLDERKIAAQNVNFAIKAAVVINFLEGHSVPFTAAGHQSPPLETAEIAEQAKQFTVYIECKR